MTVFIKERLPALIAALILFQTLFFKFSAAPESVFIFTTLGMEPTGRIGSGIAELFAVILLIFPSTAHFGALIGLGVITGAIASHLLFLGIEVQGDGGTLFYLAIIVFICCAVVLIQRKDDLMKLLPSKLKV